MKNKPEDILWSIEMIKKTANTPNGCTIKHTGGFIFDGQIDDLIELISDCIRMKEEYKSQSGDSEPGEKEVRKQQIFNEYWGGKSMKKNE